MTDLIDAPTKGGTPNGARRWLVKCVSDTMLMECGEWRTVRRSSMGLGFGSEDSSYFHFGPPVLGAPVEAVPASHWQSDTTSVMIDETGTAGMYLVQINGPNFKERKLVEDGSVFTRYGFNPPA